MTHQGTIVTYVIILSILLQSHGFEQMLTFYNLSKLGMLTDQEMTTTQPASSLGKVTSGVVAMTVLIF
jgi:hypothetical protein